MKRLLSWLTKWELQAPRQDFNKFFGYVWCADSSQAQNLRGPVTTTIKLRYNPDHHVYILREVIPIPPPDAKTLSLQSNQFKFEPIRLPGEVAVGGLAGGRPTEKVVAVGMIKVGRKSLFVVVSKCVSYLPYLLTLYWCRTNTVVIWILTPSACWTSTSMSHFNERVLNSQLKS